MREVHLDESDSYRTGERSAQRIAITDQGMGTPVTRPEVNLFSLPADSDAGEGNAGHTLSTEVGDWVIHPYWGRGVIEARAGVGGNMKLTVRFQGVTKKIVVRYARLLPG